MAEVAVDLIWTGTSGAGTTGGSTISAQPGDVVTLEIRVSTDDAGVCCAALSLRFDGDLEDELDLISAEELEVALPNPAFPPFAPLTAGVESTSESSGNQAGSVLTFEGLSAAVDGPTLTSFTLGRVDFLVTSNVGGDASDVDVEVGLFNSGVDGFGDNLSRLVDPSSIPFGTAAVELGAAPVPLFSSWIWIGALIILVASMGVLQIAGRMAGVRSKH
jgi:hypothetical protein